MGPKLMYSAKAYAIVSSGRAVPSMTVIYNGMKSHTAARGGVGRGAHPQQGLHTDARADRAPAHN